MATILQTTCSDYVNLLALGYETDLDFDELELDRSKVLEDFTNAVFSMTDEEVSKCGFCDYDRE